MLSLFGPCAGPIIRDTAQQYPRGISRLGAGDPEDNTPATNEEAHPAKGGIFKPTATLTEELMDSPGIADSKAQKTAKEQSRGDNAGTRKTKEATAQGSFRHPVGRAGGGEVHRQATLWEE
ncbi:hypothetical protein NDU88_001685 [Pleurodeles waltl]|uniref:Uncharacterized protein n=1 Tax=Pleurodeles waltl TaxID=8319 RepID=A0AAV7TII6_PLEWA|nr:hypothetical protein NDU88_001685 [Pleurodeles waltl]